LRPDKETVARAKPKVEIEPQPMVEIDGQPVPRRVIQRSWTHGIVNVIMHIGTAVTS